MSDIQDRINSIHPLNDVGQISRVYYNILKNTLLLKLEGLEDVLSLRVDSDASFLQDVMLAKPGDIVSFTIRRGRLEKWHVR